MEGASTPMWRGNGCSKKPLGWEGGIWEILVVLQLLFNFSYYKTHAKTLPKSVALYNRVKQFFTVFKFAVKLRLLPADFRRVQLSAFTYHGVKESVMALQKSLQQ